MNNINAKIVADSINPQGDRLISVLATFPRIILAEVNTHRMLSKNTSSSRAIPFTKMIESVQNDPFIPIAWQKDHKGMQGSEYFTENIDIESNIAIWLQGRDRAVATAYWLNDNKVTKQLCNRLLEPFMWTTMLITGSKEGWDNFFELRCPIYRPVANTTETFKSKKDAVKRFSILENNTDLQWLQVNKGQAEIHIMDLAEKIYDAMNESTPEQLVGGEWHIPFKDKIYVGDTTSNKSPLELLSMKVNNTSMAYSEDMELLAVKISTAMSARTSYTVVGDEKEIDYERMIGLHDRLLAQDPPHSSPMEHCARAMSDEEYYSYVKGESVSEKGERNRFTNRHYGWCRNYKGFIQYRDIVETND